MRRLHADVDCVARCSRRFCIDGADRRPQRRRRLTRAQLGPQELMQKVAQDLLTDLDAQSRRATRKDPPGCASSSTSTCCRTSTRRTRRAWCSASTGALRRRSSASASSMRSTSRCCSNYGDALLEFTADRLTVLPFQGDRATTTATVRTEVKRSNGTRVPGQLHACARRRRAGRPGTSRSRASRTSRISARTSAPRSTRRASMR